MAEIFSWCFVVLAYALLGTTYLLKNKNLIFTLSSLATTAFTISYFLINAWSGVVMSIVGLLRNMVFFLIVQKSKNSKLLKQIALSFVFVVIVFCGIITFENAWDLLSILATSFYTIAIYFEGGKFYKIFGILTSFAWIAYNFFIKLYISSVFELVMVICAIVGLVKLRKNKQKGEL